MNGTTGESDRTQDLAAAAEALRREPGLATALLEYTTRAVVCINRDGIILMSNRHVESLFGCAPGGLLYAPVDMLVVERDRARFAAYRAMYFATRQAAGTGAIPLTGRRAHGDERSLDVTLTRVPSATPAFAIVAFAERATRREPAKPRPESHLLDTLGMKAAGIAHDINNLLTIMTGCTGLVLDSCPPDDPRYELADETLQAAARATELSRQLLAATRAVTIPAIPVDVNAVVSNAMPLLRRVAGTRIDLVLALAADVGPIAMVVIDLERVIVNLVANARDAMPSGGVLRIETRAADGDRGVLIAVRDNGDGMDDETRRRMFEPFFTTKAAGRGPGLGLSIVHDIVTRAGGTIHVDSAPGAGTTVNLYFPLARRVSDDGR